MSGFLEDFVASVRHVGDRIVNAAVDIYQRITTDLLPTPEKSHYIFNLRDLSKCVQGIMQADPSGIKQPSEMYRYTRRLCCDNYDDCNKFPVKEKRIRILVGFFTTNLFEFFTID